MAQGYACTCNYTTLNDLVNVNQHVYVLGTEIIIFLLILSVFMQMSGFLLNLYKLYITRRSL